MARRKRHAIAMWFASDVFVGQNSTTSILSTASTRWSLFKRKYTRIKQFHRTDSNELSKFACWIYATVGCPKSITNFMATDFHSFESQKFGQRTWTRCQTTKSKSKNSFLFFSLWQLIRQEDPCPKYEEIYSSLLTDAPSDLQEFYEENAELFDYLTEHSGSVRNQCQF